MYIIDSNVLR